MRSLSFCFLFGSVIFNLACTNRARESAPSTDTGQGAVVVSTVKPERRNLTDRIELTGTVTPYEQVRLYARVSGYMKSIDVDIGDRVRRGQLIAVLEAPEMETELEEKRAALLQAQATLEHSRVAVDETRAEADFAEINYKRLAAIHDRDADLLPRQDVDQAQASRAVAYGKWKAAEAQVKVSSAAVATAKAEVVTLEALMKYARIDAPISGVVTERFVDPGDLIQTASASRTQAAPLVTVARIDRVRVIFDVPEPNVAQVHASTAAMVSVQGIPNPLSGRVTRVAEALSPESRTMRAEIELPNPNGRLRPGMTAKVYLVLRTSPGAITVPVGAVRSEEGERVVYVAQHDIARRVKVRTGIESPDFIEIVEGLSGNEQVIVSVAGLLKDGVSVSVRQ